MHRNTLRATMVVAFIFAMVVANLTIAIWGPWVSPINAFFLVGISMVSRDVVHGDWIGAYGKRGALVRTLGMVAVAGVVAYALNPAAGRIALASALALVLSAAIETLVFHRISNRPWLVRSNGSSAPGAAIDTVVFTYVAFGISVESTLVLLAQWATKAVGGLVWSLALAPAVAKQEA